MISPDRAVLARAAGLGARTMLQRSDGLRAGLAEARDDVVAGGADAVLVLPIDLPFVSTAAIDALLDALPASGPAVVLVADRHGTGTNALVLRPPDGIDFAFGPGSRGAHGDRARAAGAPYLEIESPLSFDLDTPDDLVLLDSTDPERIRVG